MIFMFAPVTQNTSGLCYRIMLGFTASWKYWPNLHSKSPEVGRNISVTVTFWLPWIESPLLPSSPQPMVYLMDISNNMYMVKIGCIIYVTFMQVIITCLEVECSCKTKSTLEIILHISCRSYYLHVMGLLYNLWQKVLTTLQFVYRMKNNSRELWFENWITAAE